MQQVFPSTRESKMKIDPAIWLLWFGGSMLALIPVNFGQVFLRFQFARSEAAHHRISEAACRAERGTKAGIDQNSSKEDTMTKEQERARNTGLSANPHIKGDAYSIEVAMPRAKHSPGTAKPDRKNQNSSAKR
jgi:hypothetical protein